MELQFFYCISQPDCLKAIGLGKYILLFLMFSPYWGIFKQIIHKNNININILIY